MANLVEGGENGDGGDIRRVPCDGKTNTFWDTETEGERVDRERDDHVLWCYV